MGDVHLRIGRASTFEYKYRAWIVTSLYLIALACFRFDRRDISFTLAGTVACLVPESATARLNYLIAALLVVLAAWIRTWTSAYLTAKVDENSFAADSPYRFVRHPVYLSTILLFLGFGFLLNRLGFVMLITGMVALIYRLLLRDQVREGASAAYCATVPALLPRLHARWPSSRNRAPDWRRGLLREAYLWGFGATLVTLAVTMKERPFYIALAASLFIQAASRFFRRNPS